MKKSMTKVGNTYSGQRKTRSIVGEDSPIDIVLLERVPTGEMKAGLSRLCGHKLCPKFGFDS